jgi:hypothetical protein
MRRLASFYRRRAWVAGAAGVIGLIAALARPSPPERSVRGLAELLSSAARVKVDASEIAWEPSDGALSDLFSGRRVLFLGRERPDAGREVYRAEVRLGFDGSPISVTCVRNLTQTPLGDDAGLVVRDRRAVFATVAFGRIQGISVLDLDGVREADRPPALWDRALLGVSSYQRTGSFRGVGRTDIVLDLPAESAHLRLEKHRLHVDFGEAGRELIYDMDTRLLRGTEGAEAYAARAVARVHRPKPLVFWAVDTVREEVGPGPIAWLENKVFGARDTVKRTTYALFTSSSGLRDDTEQVVARPLLDASRLQDSNWPPAPIPSLWKQPKPGEGQWEPVTYPFLKPPPGLKGSKEKPPAYFYKTFIRPDKERPYSEVLLIAMDMRQLELGVQAGYEDPQPTTGPPGEGRIPNDPRIQERVVATFNGAFKTTHGEYGMMANGRVLVPPVKGAASVVITKSGDAGLGNWPQVAGIPEEISSFRQNLDPLLEDGRLNPSGRFVWGWQIEGTSVMTQRTSLCVTPTGHLYYAFAREIDGPTLARTMRQAGCSYAIHLDMNPGHCGFVFTDIVDSKKGIFNLRLADSEMKHSPTRYVTWSAKDFFYVMVRDPVPRDASGVRWVADGGAQPPPSQIPGIFTASLQMGHVGVELFSFERGRVEWRVRAGSAELETAPPHRELASDDAHRVVAALGLGHTTTSTRYGIAFSKSEPLPLRTGYATLIVSPDSPPRVEPPGRRPLVSAHEEAVQLPLLAEDGTLLPYARSPGAARLRMALCVTSTGRLIVARTRHDSSDVLAAALLRVGCRRVVELDRGSHHPAFLHRTGTSTPPISGYETTTLYAVGRPMQPHAFRWKHEQARPAEKPTGYDISVKRDTTTNTEPVAAVPLKTTPVGDN